MFFGKIFIKSYCEILKIVDDELLYTDTLFYDQIRKIELLGTTVSQRAIMLILIWPRIFLLRTYLYLLHRVDFRKARTRVNFPTDATIIFYNQDCSD